MKRLFLSVLIFVILTYPVYADDPGPGDGISGSQSSFINESFQTDLATGAATLSIPISSPPGRKNMQPNLALSYSSNNSNGICGVGWAIPANCIQRSTKKGLPAYDGTDTFIFLSGGSNAELVAINSNEYRAEMESAFMKYIYSAADNTWVAYDKSGTKYTFGLTNASKVESGGNTFAWYLEKIEDVYGNYITYIYEKPGDGQIYIKEILYTGGSGLAPDKSVVFNYEERSDKLYSYRSGWEVVTSKRLSGIGARLNGNIVWRYELAYITSPDTSRSLLQSVTVYDKDGNSLPPKTFTYQELE